MANPPVRVEVPGGASRGVGDRHDVGVRPGAPLAGGARGDEAEPVSGGQRRVRQQATA